MPREPAPLTAARGARAFWRRARLCLLLAFALYAALAFRSTQLRHRSAEPALQLGDAEVRVFACDGAFDGRQRSARQIRLAYHEYCATPCTARPVVLLVHGSPGGKDDFEKVVPPLATRFRVIVPDLPGFGSSSRDLPDYSFRSHADELLQLLDRLQIERVHVVGFSMGGGVVLHLADSAPQRVASITLLSAIGVQEFELLGDYWVNHVLHGAQWAFLGAVQNAVPRAAFQQRSPVLSYTRNFYDSDQRPLREMLRRYAGPMLILHGEQDILVPVEAAREHQRLVPQSEARFFPTESHFMVFDERAPEIAASIAQFVSSVESGRARTRANTDPARLAAAEKPFHRPPGPRARAVSAVVFLLLLALFTALDETAGYALGGFLIAAGRLSWLPVFLACTTGAFLLLSAWLLLGRWLGCWMLKQAPLPDLQPVRFFDHFTGRLGTLWRRYFVSAATARRWYHLPRVWLRQALWIVPSAALATLFFWLVFSPLLRVQLLRDWITLQNVLLMLILLIVWRCLRAARASAHPLR
jgi:pimeloyl-ACP methyl ester carboxylesterase